jgi:uncharacterized protein YdaU (DUF1376 family)
MDQIQTALNGGTNNSSFSFLLAHAVASTRSEFTNPTTRSTTMEPSTLTPEMKAVLLTIFELEEKKIQQERLDEQRQVMKQNHYLEQTRQMGVGG